jgi:hypothetical protein
MEKVDLQDEWQNMENNEKVQWIEKLIMEKIIYRSSSD